MYSLLKSDFVVGWKNIQREYYVGQSFGYTRSQTAVGTTNGAGPHNVQIFVLSPDLVVLHALPGFWHPDDLARELWFAKELLQLWRDKTRTREQKDEMYRRMQLAELRSHPPVTYARSTWQGFDARTEQFKMQTVARDTVQISQDGYLARGPNGRPALKPINVLVHERMSRRPFVPFEDFDIAEFIDYGRKFYDLNIGVDGRGKKFFKPRRRRRR